MSGFSQQSSINSFQSFWSTSDEINQLAEVAAIASPGQGTGCVAVWATGETGPGSDQNLLLVRNVKIDSSDNVTGVRSLELYSGSTGTTGSIFLSNSNNNLSATLSRGVFPIVGNTVPNFAFNCMITGLTGPCSGYVFNGLVPASELTGLGPNPASAFAPRMVLMSNVSDIRSIGVRSRLGNYITPPVDFDIIIGNDTGSVTIPYSSFNPTVGGYWLRALGFVLSAPLATIGSYTISGSMTGTYYIAVDIRSWNDPDMMICVTGYGSPVP